MQAGKLQCFWKGTSQSINEVFMKGNILLHRERLNHNNSIISFLNIYLPLLATLASYSKGGQPVTTAEITLRLEWALCRIISSATSLS